MSVFVLHDFQKLDLEDLLGHVRQGERHVALLYCTGAGKSKMALCFGARGMAEGLFTHVVIAAPMNVIRDSFKFERRYDLVEDASGRYAPPELVTPRTVAVLRAYLSENGGRIARTSHEAMVALLGDPCLGKSMCDGKLLVIDEAHHAAPGNMLHTLREEWLVSGGAVLSMTATPWEDGREAVPKSIPARQRTLPRQMATGFAPEYLLNEVVVVKDAGAATDDDDTVCRPLDPEKTAAALVEHILGEERPKCILRIRNAGRAREDGRGGWRENHRVIKACANALSEAGLRVYVASKAHTDERDDEEGALNEAIKALNESILREVRRRAGARGIVLETREEGTLAEIREYESNVTDARDSCVDVIIGIQEVLEGFDWPLCSHVYFLGVPKSVVTLVQGIGRSVRSRKGFQHYSDYWAERSKVVFLAADPRSNKDQARVMLMACAYLSTFHQWSLIDALAPIFRKIEYTAISTDPLARVRQENAVERLMPTQAQMMSIHGLVNAAESFFREHVTVEAKWRPVAKAKMTIEYMQWRRSQGDKLIPEHSLRDVLHVLYFLSRSERKNELAEGVEREVEAGVDVVSATERVLDRLVEKFAMEVETYPSMAEEEMRKRIIALDARQIDDFGGAVIDFFRPPLSPEVSRRQREPRSLMDAARRGRRLGGVA